jgi:DNA mismatch repair protein MutL
LSGKILVLPETLTHRIAAGEVVERPASIVKELLENALDAGATEIAVELERGGCQSIRVTDNGEGIAREEVSLAFARHATSKISAFEDIYRIRSFGFRGEALPSIASVSRVEMVTRQAASPVGARIVVEGGQEKELADAGCPVGASVFVSRIFEPVPVRRKFLKAEKTEQGACLDWIVRLALAHPSVKMRVSAAGRMILNLPGVEDPAERIALTLGRDLRAQLTAAAGERAGLRLEGFVSRPAFTKSASGQMFFFVNRRYVKDPLLSHATLTAYRRVIEARRYPAVVLYLETPPDEVDVNAHPAKMEIRFRNPREVYALVAETVGSAIGAGIPQGREAGAEGGAGAGRAAYAARVEEAIRRYRVSTGPEKPFFGSLSLRQAPPTPPAAGEGPAAPEGPGGNPRFSELAYLGQVAMSYLVFAGDEGMVLVDQHAAHERILFEKLRRRAPGEREIGQRLLIPEVVSLSPRDAAFLAETAPLLEEAGMEVEPFGGDSVVVRALPAFLTHGEARTLIGDLLADCAEEDRGLPLTEKREKIFTSLACRGAVRANRILTPREVTELCRDLDAIPQAASCPHGRPVAVPVTLSDLERMFKRR